MNYDIAIIGGGPAGLTAGIYSARADLKTLLLDKKIPGGQLNDTSDVENYPGFEEAISGPELMERTRKQAERLGVDIKMEEALDIKWGEDGANHVVITDEGQYEVPVVIVSTGAGPVEIQSKGAKELKGKGLSYCAVCDGFFFRDKKLIEVGAGDSGFTEALFLTKFASEVTMVVRHPEDAPNRFRAKDQVLVNKVLENPKVKFIWNSVLEEVKGDGKVQGVVIKNVETGELTTMDDIDGVFVNIGHFPETDFLKGKLDMDSEGYLETDMRTRTKIPGVYGVGDVRKFAGEYAQAVIAAADGCIAALEAEKYLEERTWELGD
jgi:thioredoxin reductase (NADPH)